MAPPAEWTLGSLEKGAWARSSTGRGGCLCLRPGRLGDQQGHVKAARGQREASHGPEVTPFQLRGKMTQWIKNISNNKHLCDHNDTDWVSSRGC